MTLRQLEYFIAVIEEGSFSQASGRLNVSQPALSQQVRALEETLGAPLLERLGRGVRITAAGRAFLPHARATLAARSQGDRAVRDAVAGKAGELELATVISVGMGVLLRPLLVWHAEMPSVTIRMAEFSHRRALEEFAAAGGPDLAVGPTPIDWDGPTVNLGYERFVLVLSRDDPATSHVKPYPGATPTAALRSVGTLALRHLKRHQWVLFDKANGLSEIVDGHLAASGLTSTRASLRTTQFMMAANMASSGMGPTLIPANVVPADLDAIVCEPDPPLRRSLSAYAVGSLDNLVGHFIDLIRQHSGALGT
ncbi:MAG: LysR family transcriptional regulator [Hyphomicrobiaceae bacterium]|nr:LysR family transcriptional regulator [Hyphomicrobiaceae bacterium]